MLATIKNLITASNPQYEVEYEESRMMNLKADQKSRAARFAYIEEFVRGNYSTENFRSKKTTMMQIYFCRFCDFETSAESRELIRKEIESEIIIPFITKYNNSSFEKINNFRYYTPLPRFDANEVSIMLEFDCKAIIC